MGKLAMVLLFCAIVATATAPVAEGIEEGPKAVEKWFQTLPRKAPQLTNMQFYLHDIVTGKKPTVRLVVKTNGTSLAPFGSIIVIDDPLTVGPEVNSTEVGRAQGVHCVADLDATSIVMSTIFRFTSGKYNGSTLSILGHNAVLRKYREVPIVGGTGLFRLAHGIVTVRTQSFNATTADAVIHYDVSVIHY